MMARLRTLRPVLFLLVFFFVVVPLVVYNFVTFDFQRVANFERRFRGASPIAALDTEPVKLPQCLDVPSSDFLQQNVADSVCNAGRSTKVEKKLNDRQRLVHFVNVAVDAMPLWDGEEDTGREQFTYLQFAALQSIRRALQPEMLILHYVETPRGVWFTQCQRHLSLHQVLPPVSFSAMQKAGPPFLNRYERRQVLEFLVMLRTLRKQGGVAFSDFNTFLLRAPGVDMEADLVVASQSRGMEKRSAKHFGIGLHTMQAPAGHPFVAFLEQKLITMVEKNEPRLHQMPLERLVGQIVLEKYLEEHTDDLDAAAANRTVNSSMSTGKGSIMDGVIVGTSNLFEFDGLHELLTAHVGPALNGRLRGVTGFHVDRYDFTEQTVETDDLKEIARMQKELTLTDEWKNLDTLLGAVVRLAVSANTSAELDPLMK